MISNVFINNSESVISMTKNARAKAVSIGKTAYGGTGCSTEYGEDGES